MHKRIKPRAVVTLPKGVHRVIARGREYFYFQAGRGTKFQGPRTALPHEPQSPDFWIALRAAQGAPAGCSIATINSICDLYLTSPHFTRLARGTQDQYRMSMVHVRAAWGNLAASGLRPKHVREALDTFADRPGTGNNFLGFLRAFGKWGIERGHFDQSITEGVKPYKSEGGHVPWTHEQCAAAERHLTGTLRQAYFLARYTGQRGSDVVRLGPTFVDDGGFRLKQKKTGKLTGEIWCPIEPPLAAEMATWKMRPGPYLRLESGRPVTKKRLEALFAEVAGRDWTRKKKSGEAREQTGAIAELAGTTFHGLRGTRVVELRERGHNTLEISAQVGMSPPMIERYCRFADKKRLGQAAATSVMKMERKK